MRGSFEVVRATTRAAALCSIVLSCNLVLDIREGTLRPVTTPPGTCPQPVEATGTLVWAENSGSDYAFGTGVACGPGRVVVTGLFTDVFSLGGLTTVQTDEFYDMFVAAFDTATRKPAWARTFHGVGESSSFDVAVDRVSGDVVLLGKLDGMLTIDDDSWTANESDAFVIALDNEGNTRWTKQWGGPSYQETQRAVFDGAGNVIITGFGAGPLDVGLPAGPIVGTDILFLVKLDANGNALWGRGWPASNIEGCPDNYWPGCVALGLAVDELDNIYFTGATVQKLETAELQGESDVFVMKLGPDGTVLWDRMFGGGPADPEDQAATSIAVDCSGDILVAGGFLGQLLFDAQPALMNQNGRSDAFVARLDADGNALWAKGFGDTGSQSVNSLAVDGTGDVVLSAVLIDDAASAGISFGGAVHAPPGPDGPDFREDFAIARLGPDGSYRWSYRFGDTYIQQGEICAGEDGTIYAGGDFFFGIRFDGSLEGTLDSVADSRDFFVAAFHP